jgi:hypothetical protein
MCSVKVGGYSFVSLLHRAGYNWIAEFLEIQQNRIKIHWFIEQQSKSSIFYPAGSNPSVLSNEPGHLFDIRWMLHFVPSYYKIFNIQQIQYPGYPAISSLCISIDWIISSRIDF